MPLEITGRIVQRDGVRPAARAVMFVYHTGAMGHYNPSPIVTLRRDADGVWRGVRDIRLES